MKPVLHGIFGSGACGVPCMGIEWGELLGAKCPCGDEINLLMIGRGHLFRIISLFAAGRSFLFLFAVVFLTIRTGVARPVLLLNGQRLFF